MGRVVRLGDARATVVGVMPEGFAFPIYHSLWTPLRPGDLPRAPGLGALRLFGRLAPGVTLAEAQAELTTLVARAAEEFPEQYADLMPQVLPYAESIISIPPDILVRAGIYSVNVFAALFLILCCGNVALLMFARAATREKEILVRCALGASRGRIVMQFFAEALVLGALAALLGLAATSHGLKLVLGALSTESDSWPFWLEGGLSPTTLTYAVLLTFAAAATVGVLPGLKITRRGMGARLREATAGGGGLQMGGIWTGVIITQIAATVLFTAVAFVTQNQASRLASIEAAFPAEQYLTVRLEMDRESTTEEWSDTYEEDFLQRYSATVRELKRQLAMEPAVEDVTLAEKLPLMGHPVRLIEVDEAVAGDPSSGTGFRVGTAAVDLDSFEVFQTSILYGRNFDSRDLVKGANTVVVNRLFVDQILAGRNAIGRRIRFKSGDSRFRTELEPWFEIVGVVPDLVLDAKAPLNMDNPARALVYRPLSPVQPQGYPLYLAAHVRGDPNSLAPMLRRIARDVSPRLRLHDILPLNRVTGEDARSWHLFANVVLMGSVTALFLSLAGIYSVMSFTVSRRTREIGVRVALGAQVPRLIADIFRRPLGQVAAGIVLGFVLLGAVMALAGSGSGAAIAKHAGLLFAYGIAMMGVCALACIGPILRALRVEPVEALRDDT